MSIIFPTCCIGITGYPIAVQRRTRNTTVVLVALTAADTRCTTCGLGIYVIIRTRIACCISGTEQVYTVFTGSGVAIAATYRILLCVALVAGICIAFNPIAVNLVTFFTYQLTVARTDITTICLRIIVIICIIRFCGAVTRTKSAGTTVITGYLIACTDYICTTCLCIIQVARCRLGCVIACAVFGRTSLFRYYLITRTDIATICLRIIVITITRLCRCITRTKCLRTRLRRTCIAQLACLCLTFGLGRIIFPAQCF